MPLEEPSWWYRREPTWQSRLLEPIASFYGRISARRMASTPSHRSRHPVICVGNFTAGGTGKTPFTRYLAELLHGMGHAPVVLTRGYGGRVAGPQMIDAARDRPADTGDEPLLLATTVPVCIARDRAAGGRFLDERPSGTVIVMDDGLQNPGLAKDLTIAIVDGRRGVGNGHVIPAGPLRAPLALQLARTDVIVINEGVERPETGAARAVATQFRRIFGGPILHAAVAPAGDVGWLDGAKIIAYAGIANPSRFFGLLETLGADIRATVAFRDHQSISEDAARSLIDHARSESAVLVTTEKDFVRLPRHEQGVTDPRTQLRDLSRMFPIKVVMPESDEAQLRDLLGRALTGTSQA